MGADSANLLVQNRMTGQLIEEKMQIYVVRRAISFPSSLFLSVDLLSSAWEFVWATEA